MKSECTYCKSDNSSFKYSTIDIFESKFNIHQCNECSAFFLAPNPTQEQLAEAYSESYYGEKEEKFEGIFEKAMDFFRKKRAVLLTKKLPNGASVLDIGCGNGRFLSSLLNYGDFKLFGVELEGNSAKRAARIKEINLKVGTIDQKDFPESSLDAVSMFHVFEHLTQPKETLEIVSEILKKDGLFVVSFPNIDSWQSKFFKGKWLHLDPPRHLFFFAPIDFKMLMKQLGFELVHENYSSIEQNPFGMIQSILNKLCEKREVLFERLKGNNNYAKEYGKLNIVFQKIFFISLFPFFVISNLIIATFKKGATVEFIFKKIK
ncbi:MAG: class I SAM-dependent methyltransferase [Bacteroidetes bacterium]|nr:class I SAM-dependent methyltransferase [Bacteroidota bacterium]